MSSARSPPRNKGSTADEVHYTTLIRLPFPRRDFVDPALVEWDRSKDRQLWKILSRAPRSADLNWKELAERFEVTLPFILQQAAWMYERQLSQMREQMRKVSQQSKAQGSTQIGGQSMQRQGSSDASRPRSLVEIESPLPTSLNATPRVGSSASREHPLPARMAPPISRTTSTNTITQSQRAQPSSPGPTVVSPAPSPQRPSPRQGNAALSPSVHHEQRTQQQDSSNSSSDGSDDDSSSSDQATSKVLRRSQVFKRAPRFASNRKPISRHAQQIVESLDGENARDGEDNEDEEGEDDSPAFLPLSGSGNDDQDLKDTLRTKEQTPITTEANDQGITQIPSQANTDSSVSSVTSSAAPVASPAYAVPGQRPSLGALSPRQQAELAKLSPRGKYLGKDGSEGTPSMGSSFSDLDDTSVTQSALEDALNSNLQHGAASRMSNISQALRSKYL